MNLNKVIHIGRLTRDPELQYKEGRDGEAFAVCNIGLAINRPKFNKDADDVADFFDWSATGRTAENIANYFKSGDEILLEGSAQYRTWETDEGYKRSKVDFKAYRFEFGQKSKKNQEQQSQNGTAQAQDGGQASVNTGGNNLDAEDFDDPAFDDIPF